MTTKNLTAIRGAESDEAAQRLKLADNAMKRGEDYGLASCVVEEVTEALVQIRRDFECWDMDHEHTPKEVQS